MRPSDCCAYVVVWDHAEQGYAASCVQYPLLAVVADTKDDALARLKDLVDGALDSFEDGQA